jgi:hypothetical protein
MTCPKNLDTRQLHPTPASTTSQINTPRTIYPLATLHRISEKDAHSTDALDCGESMRGI